MQDNHKELVTGARSVVAVTAKQAMDLSAVLDGAKNMVSNVDLKNPLHTGVLGAGAGALGGLASGAMSDKEEPDYLARALAGGLTGGGVGAGAGILNKHMSAPQLPNVPQSASGQATSTTSPHYA